MLIASPALTYTLDDFISMKLSDDMTYYNFSILEIIDGVEHLDNNIVETYIDILKSGCMKVKLSSKELKNYRYNPDILAYDLYGSVQLDFVILILNDMYDPKEFNKTTLYLPKPNTLSKFLNAVYSKESGYLEQNRADCGILF